jgi:hypothetical protein
MTSGDETAVTLADRRALMYFGAVPERPAEYPDRRQLAAVHIQSQARWDPLLGEWVIITSHRQDRTFQPAVGQCPLCPSAWHQASVRCRRLLSGGRVDREARRLGRVQEALVIGHE